MITDSREVPFQEEMFWVIIASMVILAKTDMKEFEATYHAFNEARDERDNVRA
jgi:hypothetical protein